MANAECSEFWQLVNLHQTGVRARFLAIICIKFFNTREVAFRNKLKHD